MENAPKIVMASCALHNYLRKKSPHYMTRNCVDFEDIEQHTFRPGDWRQNDNSTGLDRSERQRTEDERQVRQIFTEYFNGEGSVDFQERMDKCAKYLKIYLSFAIVAFIVINIINPDCSWLLFLV